MLSTLDKDHLAELKNAAEQLTPGHADSAVEPLMAILNPVAILDLLRRAQGQGSVVPPSFFEGELRGQFGKQQAHSIATSAALSGLLMVLDEPLAEVARALGRLGDRRALDCLVLAAKGSIMLPALPILQAGTPDLAEMSLRLASQKHRDAAIQALLCLHRPEAIGPLSQIANDQDDAQEIRKAAAEAVSRLRAEFPQATDIAEQDATDG